MRVSIISPPHCLPWRCCIQSFTLGVVYKWETWGGKICPIERKDYCELLLQALGPVVTIGIKIAVEFIITQPAFIPGLLWPSGMLPKANKKYINWEQKVLLKNKQKTPSVTYKPIGYRAAKSRSTLGIMISEIPLSGHSPLLSYHCLSKYVSVCHKHAAVRSFFPKNALLLLLF